MINKVIVAVLVFLMIGISAFPSMGQNIKEKKYSSSSARTVYVDDNNTDGPWDGTPEHPFRYIQDGINKSIDGDVVFVFAGLYMENVHVNKSINLTGENRENTIVDANGNDCPFTIETSEISLSGFTAQHSGTGNSYDAGIKIRTWAGDENIVNKFNISIYNNILMDNQHGIYVLYSKYDSFHDNIIKDNLVHGFYCECQLYYSNISDNVIENNEGDGIHLFVTEYSDIFKNTIASNKGKAIYAIECNTILIAQNSIENNSCGIVIEGRSWYINILSNRIANNELGINIYGDRYINVSKNNFIDNIRHAKISYNFLSYILLHPITRWTQNYWSGNQGVMKIKGTMTFNIIIFRNPYDNFPIIIPISIPWHQSDFSPAKTPYEFPD